jgi:hypothetical protein
VTPYPSSRPGLLPRRAAWGFPVGTGTICAKMQLLQARGRFSRTIFASCYGLPAPPFTGRGALAGQSQPRPVLLVLRGFSGAKKDRRTAELAMAPPQTPKPSTGLPHLVGRIIPCHSFPHALAALDRGSAPHHGELRLTRILRSTHSLGPTPIA